MSDNWVVQNLENALETWNDKLSEIWQLLTTTPQDFKGGSIWNVMVTINGAVQAIGLGFLVKDYCDSKMQAELYDNLIETVEDTDDTEDTMCSI